MQLIETSPAAHLKDIIPTKPSTPYKHCTDPKRLGEILLILERAGTFIPATKALLKVMPILFTRPTEVREMRWNEIDGDLWTVPAERMKKRVALLVPLPTQVLKILEEMKIHTGHYDFVFANPRTGKPVSSGALDRLKRRQGLHDEITWHGFRHTASTLLNEKGYNRDHIESQLAHMDGNAVRGTYNHARYLAQRQKMLQEWADYLDELKQNALSESVNVLH